MYDVKILLDSRAPSGSRLTTFELQYPRFVHAELMTHRVFSRNSASSRAIPVKTMLARIKNDPVLPVWWGKNQSGMQAKEELQGEQLEQVMKTWLEWRDIALQYGDKISEQGLHKQIANRPLEAWMFITVIVSSTSYNNWFRLRHHPDAQPEIQFIAERMLHLYKASVPQELEAEQWHMPLMPDIAELKREFSIQQLKAISAGRIARVSYLTHDGIRDPQKDIELGMGLGTRMPPHMSPLEHVAQALEPAVWHRMVRAELKRAVEADELFNPMMLGNLVGWKQFRKEFNTEHGFDHNIMDMT
jgi:hypothetical protein